MNEERKEDRKSGRDRKKGKGTKEWRNNKREKQNFAGFERYYKRREKEKENGSVGSAVLYNQISYRCAPSARADTPALCRQTGKEGRATLLLDHNEDRNKGNGNDDIAERADSCH